MMAIVMTGYARQARWLEIRLAEVQSAYRGLKRLPGA